MEARLSAQLAPYASRMLAILRIVTALLFIEHGTMKLLGFPAQMPMELTPLLYVAGILELVGGLLVLIGFMTRTAAFILSGEMAVAYFMAHFPKSIYPVLNGGEGAVLFCFVFLYLACAGGGLWSVDASRGKA